MHRCMIGMIALMAMTGGPLNAQSPRQPTTREAFGGSPLFWSTETIMELWVRQVTRYYNLSPEQEDYTRKLMAQRVKSFLKDYERDVRALMAEYMDYQTSQELPPPDVAMDFARRAGPLVAAMRREIFEGNMAWREILDDEQRSRHDRDLEQMTAWFDNLSRGLSRWERGEVEPTDIPGRVSRQPPSVRRIEDAWEYYVRHFIQAYQLDDGQQQVAHSILRELKAEAQRYRQSRADAFARLDEEAAQLRAGSPKQDPKDREAYQQQFADLTQRRKEIERPISALFDQLRSRLETIPTEDQRRNRQRQMENLKRRYATRPAATEPAATRPARPPATQTSGEQAAPGG